MPPRSNAGCGGRELELTSFGLTGGVIFSMVGVWDGICQINAEKLYEHLKSGGKLAFSYLISSSMYAICSSFV